MVANSLRIFIVLSLPGLVGMVGLVVNVARQTITHTIFCGNLKYLNNHLREIKPTRNHNRQSKRTSPCNSCLKPLPDSLFGAIFATQGSTNSEVAKMIIEDVRSYEQKEEQLALLKILLMGEKDAQAGKGMAADEFRKQLAEFQPVEKVM